MTDLSCFLLNSSGLMKSVSSTSFFTLPLIVPSSPEFLNHHHRKPQPCPALPCPVLEFNVAYCYNIVFVSVGLGRLGNPIGEGAKRLLTCSNEGRFGWLFLSRAVFVCACPAPLLFFCFHEFFFFKKKKLFLPDMK